MSISRFANTYQAQESEPEEEIFEATLRPQNFNQVIGRQREKQALQMMIKAVNTRSEPLDHILFHGPPGLGKTSLAHVVAKEMGTTIQITSGPAIEKQGDLAAILTSLPRNAILFIDEIHRLNRTVEEILYPAMEDRVLDIIVGKGAGAKTLRVDLEPFTIIAATTRVGLISKPLLDRFGVDFRLDFYSISEMTELVLQKAKWLKAEIDLDAALMIAERSRRTPRIALKILKRVRENALANNRPILTSALVEDTLQLLEIDNQGLDYLDRKILQTIIEKFQGGPVGLNSLAASLSEEIDTISSVYEPYLLQEGFLIRTARGRRVTLKTFSHFNIAIPEDWQTHNIY